MEVKRGRANRYIYIYISNFEQYFFPFFSLLSFLSLSPPLLVSLSLRISRSIEHAAFVRNGIIFHFHFLSLSGTMK